MSQFFEDVPSGVIDGTNISFTLHYAPATIFGGPSVEVYLNGLLQEPDGVDFTLNDLNITYVQPPQIGDAITAWVFQS